MKDPEELFEVSHVAKRLKTSLEYVRRLIRNRQLPAIQFDGGHYRIESRELDAFIERRRTIPRNHPQPPSR